MLQILEALVFMEERRVAHLNIKPDNVFIDANGDMKIGDFGLCKSVTTKKGAVTTIDGNSYGTEGFIAPEITKGQPANTKADVYSTGVLIFSFVMLRSAERTDPHLLKINAELWPNNGNRASLAQRMLEADPASRPLASEILDELKVKAGAHTACVAAAVLFDCCLHPQADTRLVIDPSVPQVRRPPPFSHCLTTLLF